MNLKLQNKKVLLTGATRGLGLALANAFLEEGAAVAICSRDERNLAFAQKKLSPFSGQVFFLKADAAKPEQIAGCIQAAVRKLRGLDILINNAGGAPRFGSFFDLMPNDWEEAFRLNVLSAVFFSKEAYPFLKKSKAPRIINIASITGLQPGGFNPHYAASKAALLNLNKHLANLFSKEKILVNAVAAGPFQSESWKRNAKRTASQKNLSLKEALKEEADFASQSIPLRRIARAEEILATVLLLASEKTTWQTGSCVVLDGGKLKGIH